MLLFTKLKLLFKQKTISILELKLPLDYLILDQRKSRKKTNNLKLFFFSLFLQITSLTLLVLSIFLYMNWGIPFLMFSIFLILFGLFFYDDIMVIGFLLPFSPLIITITSLFLFYKNILIGFYLLSSDETKLEIQTEVRSYLKAKRIAKRNDKFIDEKSLKSKQLLEIYNQKELNPSLKKFIQQRLHKGENGQINYFLLFYVITLPLEKMSLDGAKQIIQNGVNLWMSEKSFDYEKIFIPERKNFIKNPSLVNEFWGNLTEPQIKKLLTKQFSSDEYISFIKSNLTNEEIDYSGKCIAELVVTKQRDLLNPVLKSIKSSDPAYRFMVLKNHKDYKKARDDFKNCVESYFDRKNLDIICLYEKETKTPKACVSVDSSLNLIEIKNTFNREVNVKIKTIVKNSLESLKEKTA